MVLFFCVFLGVLLVAAALLWRMKVAFSLVLAGEHVHARAELRILFGLLKIPFEADMRIGELLCGKGRKPRKNTPKRNRFLRKILWEGRRTGALALSEFQCRGLVGDASDAFRSVMAAGAVQIALELLLNFLFPLNPARVAIAPSFEQNAIWVYMEGILEIVPTQIIGVLIEHRTTGRERA